jgi:hypothetical protein
MSEQAKKAGIMSVATTMIGAGAVRLASGEVYVGATLTLAGMGLFGLYEVYQVRQLPAGLDEDEVRAIAEEVGTTVGEAVDEQTNDT